jgi:outer membrane protein OmpA-like peptidoglycan-associated protein
MNKTITFIIALAMPLAAHSQVAREHVPNNNFVTHGFGENWFVSIGAGVQRYIGEHDLKEKFDKALHPLFDISVGKWLVPTLGVRAQLSGYQLGGLTDDPSNVHVSNPAPVQNNLHSQRWKQFNVHVDALLNVSNWWGGYREGRVYECVPFLGIGLIHAMNHGGNTEPFLAAGIVNKFRASDRLDLNVELRGNLVPDAFDGESGGLRVDGLLAVAAGISYKIRNTPFVRATVGVRASEYYSTKEALLVEMARAERLQAELEAERAKIKTVEQEIEQPLPYLFFHIGSVTLDPAGLLILGQIADAIKRHPDAIYSITGYADQNTGSASRNRELSERRALHVAHTLVNHHGVNPGQLVVDAKGGVAAVLGTQEQLNRVVIVEKIDTKQAK